MSTEDTTDVVRTSDEQAQPDAPKTGGVRAIRALLRRRGPLAALLGWIAGLVIGFVLGVAVVLALLRNPETAPVLAPVPTVQRGQTSISLNVRGDYVRTRVAEAIAQQGYANPEVSFEAPDKSGQTITIDKAYVNDRIGKMAADSDLSRFVL